MKLPLPFTPMVFATLLVVMYSSEGANTLDPQRAIGNNTESPRSSGLCDSSLSFPNCENCCTGMKLYIACVNSVVDLEEVAADISYNLVSQTWLKGAPPFITQVVLKPGNQLIATLSDGILVVSQQVSTAPAGCYCTSTSDCP